MQPDLVSVEEVSTGAGAAYQVSIESGTALATIHEGALLLTNDEILLNDYLSGSESETGVCPSVGSQIDPAFLLSQVDLQHIDPHYAALTQLFTHFSNVQLEFKKYSTDVYLCTI